VGTSLFYYFYNKALSLASAHTAALYTYLQPIFGIALAVLILDEPVSIMFVVGGACTLLGLSLALGESSKSIK
jgi:drug/metabolite transporter (DMT)-like permease